MFNNPNVNQKRRSLFFGIVFLILLVFAAAFYVFFQNGSLVTIKNDTDETIYDLYFYTFWNREEEKRIEELAPGEIASFLHNKGPRGENAVLIKQDERYYTAVGYLEKPNEINFSIDEIDDEGKLSIVVLHTKPNS